MKSYRISLVTGCFLLCAALTARAEVQTAVEMNDAEHATGAFAFKHVPAPSKDDAATKATFTLIDGARDRNGGELDALHDGRTPAAEDEPGDNFFFGQRSDGGRILVDLGSAIDIKQINTYSWHAGTRGPQVYTVYGADGKASDFKSKPTRETDPEKAGWKKVASVDTRPKDGAPGGQFGVSLSDTAGTLGHYRYLLFDCRQTEDNDPFGNTFYSEIDVIDRDQLVSSIPTTAPATRAGVETVEIEDGKYRFTVDTSETPDLTEWAHNELVPVVREWYPKIVAMLPSEGYKAPAKFSITFYKNMDGVANTGGTRVSCAERWFKASLKGEAKGAVVHELVHVVQQYGGRRRQNPNAQSNPGWLVEGIPDYIRWYKYEPQSHGANIAKRAIARARYDASYRTSANFLNYVIGKYDKDLVEHLNAAMRRGEYNDAVWKTHTGKTAPELGEEWKAALEKE